MAAPDELHSKPCSIVLHLFERNEVGAKVVSGSSFYDHRVGTGGALLLGAPSHGVLEPLVLCGFDCMGSSTTTHGVNCVSAGCRFQHGAHMSFHAFATGACDGVQAHSQPPGLESATCDASGPDVLVEHPSWAVPVPAAPILPVGKPERQWPKRLLEYCLVHETRTFHFAIAQRPGPEKPAKIASPPFPTGPTTMQGPLPHALNTHMLTLPLQAMEGRDRPPSVPADRKPAISQTFLLSGQDLRRRDALPPRGLTGPFLLLPPAGANQPHVLGAEATAPSRHEPPAHDARPRPDTSRVMRQSFCQHEAGSRATILSGRRWGWDGWDPLPSQPPRFLTNSRMHLCHHTGSAATARRC